MANAVERLEAAIDKLEQMRAERGYVEVNGWLAEENPGDTTRSWLEPRYDLSPVTNDELLVTLHRTIDAQLDLLRLARGFYGAQITGPEAASAFAESVLALADAILSGGPLLPSERARVAVFGLDKPEDADAPTG